MNFPTKELLDAELQNFLDTTGDSPTHVLVTPTWMQEWTANGGSRSYELNSLIMVDFMEVKWVPNWHHPSFPQIVRLPQTIHFKRPGLWKRFLLKLKKT